MGSDQDILSKIFTAAIIFAVVLGLLQGCVVNLANYSQTLEGSLTIAVLLAGILAFACRDYLGMLLRARQLTKNASLELANGLAEASGDEDAETVQRYFKDRSFRVVPNGAFGKSSTIEPVWGMVTDDDFFSASDRLLGAVNPRTGKAKAPIAALNAAGLDSDDIAEVGPCHFYTYEEPFLRNETSNKCQIDWVFCSDEFLCTSTQRGDLFEGSLNKPSVSSYRLQDITSMSSAGGVLQFTNYGKRHTIDYHGAPGSEEQIRAIVAKWHEARR